MVIAILGLHPQLLWFMFSVFLVFVAFDSSAKKPKLCNKISPLQRQFAIEGEGRDSAVHWRAQQVCLLAETSAKGVSDCREGASAANSAAAAELSKI